LLSFHQTRNLLLLTDLNRLLRGDEMKLGSSLVLLACLGGMFIPIVAAQNANSTAQSAENLRAQLRDVQAKENELQTRAKQLDEDLKPANIERSLAGIGSTRPEELRELRRRQLSIEKASVLTQLEQLAARRVRLESAILAADTAAYQQSAQGTSTPLNQIGLTQYMTRPYWLVWLFVGFLAVVSVVALFVVIRKL
jgi:hypothetical protein